MTTNIPLDLFPRIFAISPSAKKSRIIREAKRTVEDGCWKLLLDKHSMFHPLANGKVTNTAVPENTLVVELKAVNGKWGI